MAAFSPEIQAWILASEGGYVDHPDDPGGATNFGITLRTLAAWRGRAVDKADVRALGRDEALEILRAQYWNPIAADRLPVGLDYALFDYAVHSGPARAVKDLQRVLGVAADGILGAQTLAAIHHHDAGGLIEALCARRWAFLQGLSTFAHFGRGWRRRLWGETAGAQPGSDNGVADRALQLARGGAMTRPNTAPVAGPGKAAPEAPGTVASLTRDPAGLSALGAAAAALAGAIADQPILQLATVALIGALVWRFVLAQRSADPA